MAGTFKGTATFGTTTLTYSSYGDATFMRVDSSGTPLWAIKVGGTSSCTGCGYGKHGIVADGSGGAFVTGSFSGSASFGSFSLRSGVARCCGRNPEGIWDDVFILRVNSAGTVLWAERAGGGSARGYGIARDDSGGVFVAGGFESTMRLDWGDLGLMSWGKKDGFVLRLNSAGARVWSIKLGGAGYDEALAIAADGAGGALVTGYFTSATLHLGNSTSATFDAITLTGGSSKNVFVTRLSSNGTVLWAVKAGG